ncbi:hypothetical protein AB6C47_018270 [Vibrio cyclitrophicus]
MSIKNEILEDEFGEKIFEHILNIVLLLFFSALIISCLYSAEKKLIIMDIPFYTILWEVFSMGVKLYLVCYFCFTVVSLFVCLFDEYFPNKNSKQKLELVDAKDEIEQSVLNHYNKQIKLRFVTTQKVSLIEERCALLSEYRKHGLKHFESKNKDKITGILGSGDSRSTNLVVKEFYRLCCVKAEALEEQYKQDALKPKHDIDKVCIKARFWDNLFDLEHNFLLFKSSLDEFDTDLNSSDLSASEKLELSLQKIQFVNKHVEMFGDTERLIELVLDEISNNNHKSEKIAVMETA